MSADLPAARHIEVDREGRKWTGSYRLLDKEIEVHSSHGTRKAMTHDMPTATEQRQAYLDGLARLLLIEIVDRHLGVRG